MEGPRTHRQGFYNSKILKFRVFRPQMSSWITQKRKLKSEKLLMMILGALPVWYSQFSKILAFFRNANGRSRENDVSVRIFYWNLRKWDWNALETHVSRFFAMLLRLLWFLEGKKNWRRAYKSMLLLDYLLKNGSERVVGVTRDHLYDMRALEHYTHTDEKGKDQGSIPSISRN